jgi:hypothetical protein
VILLSALGVFYVFFWLNAGLTTTTLDADGLRTRTIFRSRFYPWSDIRQVSAREYPLGGGEPVTRVAVDLASGPSVRLPVPMPGTVRGRPDPRFAAEVAQIQGYLYSATGRSPEPS